MTKLYDIFVKHKCDKGPKHRYDMIYEKDFEHIKNMPIKILEIGIFKGESISSWLEFFPNASIYGIDIFDRVHPKNIKILQNKRVKWLQHDSTDSNLPNAIKNEWGDVLFDIIIDDGLHTPSANLETFKNTIDFLKWDGTYYIEDFWLLKDKNVQKHPWIKKYKDEYSLDKYEKLIKETSEYEVLFFDNRNISNEPDSVIMSIQK